MRETKNSPWPAPTEPEPTEEDLTRWEFDEGECNATDGCWVEPDGTCPHGHPSWMIYLGLI
jgi:hypothetical protein